MGLIPDFNLPSNPAVTVRLREATVSDALDFSGVSEEMQEVATSLFLDRLQDNGKWTDPRTWTGQDRRFALFWYWLHTEKDHDVALTFACPVCGGEHTKAVDYRTLADNYRQMKGKPERDVEFQGATVTVAPLIGACLEELETHRIAVQLAEEKHGKNSGEARKERTRLALIEIVLCVRFSDEPREMARAFREQRIERMTVAEFEALATLVADAVEDMAHGLECEMHGGQVVLLTPPIACPEKPQEVGTRLRVPFRPGEYIPRVF